LPFGGDSLTIGGDVAEESLGKGRVIPPDPPHSVDNARAINAADTTRVVIQAPTLSGRVVASDDPCGCEEHVVAHTQEPTAFDRLNGHLSTLPRVLAALDRPYADQRLELIEGAILFAVQDSHPFACFNDSNASFLWCRGGWLPRFVGDLQTAVDI